MNARQVIILWIVAAVLAIAVTGVKLGQKASRDTATDRSPGDTLFADFPAADVATITITDTEHTSTVRKSGDAWVVAERDDYPARTSSALELLRTLGELKITQAMEAGPSFAPRFGMDENSKNADDRGITATFNDASGKQIARVSFGKPLEGGSGRFVRNHTDDSGFYAVSETFHSLQSNPARWLDDGFIRLEKIRSITVADAASPDAPLWRISRATENDNFSLADGAPGETLDDSIDSQAKNLMGFARFQDVVPAANVESRTATTPAPRLATINTFDGFTYTLRIRPAKPLEMPDLDEGFPPPDQDNQLLTLTVEAELPTERGKADEETPEIAAELEAAFKQHLESLNEKLTRENAFADRTFEVGQHVVELLLKNREDITAATPEPPVTTAPQPAPTPAVATTPPIQAVTPPIAIPPLVDDEDEDETNPADPE